MNKMKKLLSVLLAIVIALSCMSVMASAAKTQYQTVANLKNLDAYSPYGQVTRLSTEERTSIVLDFLDNVLPGLNINMGTVIDVLGLTVMIDLTSVDQLCKSFDSIYSTFNNTLFSIAKGIVNLGILEDVKVSTWQSGMTRAGTDQYKILSELVEVISAQKGIIYDVVSTGSLDLGIIGGALGDISAVTDLIGDIPGLIKGLVWGLFERWDDTLTEIKAYDTSAKGNGGIESTLNTFVKSLFTNNMSITTVKYDANGNMTSEHTGMPISTAAPAKGVITDANAPRCYYQITGTTPGSVMTVYHLVDEAEAKTLAKTPDEINGSPAAYSYFKEKQTYVMAEEVEGSGTYVWKATDEFDNTWTMKWYNDDSRFLPSLNFTPDLSTMSAGDLLYKFIPVVFAEMAPVVLNGSMKKILAELFGAKFTYVGVVGETATDKDAAAIAALPDAGNVFFTQEQGEYLWEWSDYAVINGNHYYRFQDQIYAADLSYVNNYFDIINWNFKITDDFMNEFIPADASDASNRILPKVNDFLVKVAETVLVASANTDDTASDYTATWTRPAFAKGGNQNLVNNIKALAQAFIKLAPQHIFGSDYTTNPRCYYSMLISDKNDVVLTGIAAQLVDIIMPSMTLPTAAELVADNTKVGAILAAVIREFAAQLTPQFNYDALIYADFGTTTADPVKTFVSGKDSNYWLDLILTMGINVGFEYIRAFADMGEGTDEWNAFISYSGYAPEGKTYTAMTTAELNAYWEGMVDYLLDWALDKDFEWAWKMENIVNTSGLTIDMKTAQDPWAKLQQILGNILPVDEILTVETTDPAGNTITKMEHFLRYDLILGIVDLNWGHLVDTITFNGTNKYFRTANVLDQLAKLVKGIVNSLFTKLGGGSFTFIPSAVTDFDSLANQANIATLARDLVGVLYSALVTNGGLNTLMPFINFLLGWKTDPQVMAEPQMWTSFRDGNDYAFQWTGQTGYPTIDSSSTIIKLLNNSAGMLEIHRNSDITDHAYDINIRSVTSDATVNTVTFTYDNVVSPWETIDIKVGGTFKGDEAITVTVEYDYVGKDGKAVGGTQYTSLTFLISNLYEDSNLSTCWDSDHDKDYTGLTDVKGYVFTETLYDTVTNYTAEIHYVSASLSNPDKSFVSCQPEGYTKDCKGNVTAQGNQPTGQAANYFAQYMGQDGGWASKLQKEGTTSTTAKLYYAKNGVTADTVFPYGAYDMGEIGVKYGSDTKVIVVDFIHYNDYDIGDIYEENKNNGYNAHQGVDSATWEAYRTAWNKIVYLATFPMMTTSRNAANWEGVTSAGTASNDYVTAIMPQIEPAIEAYEAAKEAYEIALKAVQSASGAGDADVPSWITALEAQNKLDYTDEEAGTKEINFQDYAYYEYFNYADLRTIGRNMVAEYQAPEVMDTYYILNSGIREAELDAVMAAEANPFIAAGIAATRLENDPDAILASKAALAEWKQPTYTYLNVADLTARIAYYKQFVNDSVKDDADHLYFLNLEIAHVEAQGFVEADYEAVSWARYADALAAAKAVANGTDEYASFNSRIFDVKWELMNARKQLLLKADSLIEAGGTAELEANIDIANAIFASLAAGDDVWYLAPDYEGEADDAYAALIQALGYYYEGEDGNTWNLYADSALEYADNDRPNRQANQAKVNAANAALVAAIENFETAEVELDPNTGIVKDDAIVEATFDDQYASEDEGIFGFIYGIDTLANITEDGSLMDNLTTNYGDAYLEIIGDETTGTIINVLDLEGNVVETYVFIYFGDIDADGMISSTDGFMAEYYEAMGEGIDTVYALMAGDVDGSGDISSTDGFNMEYFEAMGEGLPSQQEIAEMVSGNYYEL